MADLGMAGGDSPKYFLVMDFEATCELDDRSWPNEIIEFPAVLLDATTLEAVSEFREFVRPTERPLLTAFCTELTGIVQADVEGADTLDRVLFHFTEWLAPYVGGDPHAALPVTCGDWDLQTMLPKESKRKSLKIPATLRRWCNVKVAFLQATGDKGRGMADMLSALGLPLVGRHHSGIDDARNIATILVAGATLRPPRRPDGGHQERPHTERDGPWRRQGCRRWFGRAPGAEAAEEAPAL